MDHLFEIIDTKGGFVDLFEALKLELSEQLSSYSVHWATIYDVHSAILINHAGNFDAVGHFRHPYVITIDGNVLLLSVGANHLANHLPSSMLPADKFAYRWDLADPKFELSVVVDKIKEVLEARWVKSQEASIGQ